MSRFMEKLGLKNLNEGLNSSFIKSDFDASELLDSENNLLGYSLIGEFIFKKASLYDLVNGLNEVGEFDKKFWNFKFDHFQVQLFISEEKTIVFHSTVDRPKSDEMLDFFCLGVDLGTAVSRARILLGRAIENSIASLSKKLEESPTL
mgnify:CR=1 FL=1